MTMHTECCGRLVAGQNSSMQKVHWHLKVFLLKCRLTAGASAGIWASKCVMRPMPSTPEPSRKTPKRIFAYNTASSWALEMSPSATISCRQQQQACLLCATPSRQEQNGGATQHRRHAQTCSAGAHRTVRE